MFDETPSLPTCPICQTEFTLKRKDQRYCGRACQKNATRGSRKAADSWDEMRRVIYHQDLARRHAEHFYTIPPAERLAFVIDIIRSARTSDTRMRNVLTDPTLLWAKPKEKWLFFRKCPASYRTISQIAEICCRELWGAGVADVVHGRCPEFERQSASTYVVRTPSCAPELPLQYVPLDPAEFLTWLRTSRENFDKTRRAPRQGKPPRAYRVWSKEPPVKSASTYEVRETLRGILGVHLEGQLLLGDAEIKSI